MSVDRRPGPRPAEEAERVAILHDLMVLDQPDRDDLAGIVRLAGYVCGTPTAAVNLIDTDRQVQVAAYGAEPTDCDRDDSMCTHAVLSQEVTYVPDATLNETFAQNPHVTGELGQIRLYVAAPLLVGDHAIGTLCAFASEPGSLSRLQLERLRDLAAATTQLLTLRTTVGHYAHVATRDPLTGLPHRRFLLDAMDLSFARRARTGARPAAIFVDLDGFKEVNDTQGHATGDALLSEVTDRLLGAVRASDLVARLGGDEFVVFVEDTGDPEDPLVPDDGLDLLTQRVRDALNTSVLLPTGVVRLAASVGAARCGDSADTPGDLLARADAAMYAEKQRRARDRRSAEG